MSSEEWEGEFNWFATGRRSYLVRPECRCSPKRSPSLRLVSPMERRPQRVQRKQYTTLADVKVNICLMWKVLLGPGMGVREE
eukprot:g9650.t1